MFIAMLDALAQSDALGFDHALRVAVAVLLGGAVGLERELRDKPAGFRTIILISVGACVFTILSQEVGGPDWNSTRIAAQVVTGIGFLGAGAILRDRTNVVGLTTAATIWAVAAIGMAAGFGDFGLATLGTAAILVVLLAFNIVEAWIGDRRDIQTYQIVASNAEDSLQRIVEMFARANLKTRKRTCYEEGSSLIFNIRAMGTKSNHERLRMTLAHSDEYQLRRS
ncbi:MAG: MgtC/SapB family protein [Planctomycetota bacterium]|jgi:putative Mg2+ transporter-C (MgtC) family protein